MSTKVAFLGLGVMGYPMAGHLARAGHHVTVYNRTLTKAKDWLKEFRDAGRGGHCIGTTPQAAVEGVDIAFACVGADNDLRDVTTGPDGALQNMKKGTVFVDHTTTSAIVAREMADTAAKRGLGFLDAPVSGGEAGAQNGQLTIMAGGEKGHFKAAEPAMQAYAKMVKRVGDAGAGQTTKMVNQICIAGIVQGLSEAVNFARSAGLDTDAVLEVISKGAAQSWQMDNRWDTMVRDEFDFGFAVDWMRKDLGIVMEEARRLGITVPVTALVDQFYADVQAMGGNRQDTSSLLRRLRR